MTHQYKYQRNARMNNRKRFEVRSSEKKNITSLEGLDTRAGMCARAHVNALVYVNM